MRTRRALPGLLAGVLALTAQESAPILPRPAPAASVVMVRGTVPDPSASGFHRAAQGSGVVVAPGRVLTNAHVATGQRFFTVAHEGRSWPAFVRGVDPARDLCLLEAPGLPLPPVTPAPFGTARPGLPVQTLGFPASRRALGRGTLVALWRFGHGTLLQVDAPTAPGSSGGGLFDEEGRFLGLTTLRFDESPSLSFALALDQPGDLSLPSAPEEFPAVPDLFAGLVESVAEHPENRAAWEAFAEAWTRQSPKDPQAWYARGCALHDRLRASRPDAALDEALWGEAEASFRRAVTLRPGFPQGWNNLGTLLELRNRFQEAEAAVLEALRQEPDYPLAWANLGHIRFNDRRFRDAEPCFATALRYRPLDGVLWWKRGLAAAGAGPPGRGLPFLRRAAELLPERPEVWADLARLQAGSGDREGLGLTLQRLRSLDPTMARDLARELGTGRGKP